MSLLIPYYEFWVIRQKSTGFFLPAGGKGKRGHTHQSPSPTEPPRLFKEKVNAVRGLKAWLAGKWIESYYTSSLGEPDYDGPAPRKVESRSASDYEVISVTIKAS